MEDKGLFTAWIMAGGDGTLASFIKHLTAIGKPDPTNITKYGFPIGPDPTPDFEGGFKARSEELGRAVTGEPLCSLTFDRSGKYGFQPAEKGVFYWNEHDLARGSIFLPFSSALPKPPPVIIIDVPPPKVFIVGMLPVRAGVNPYGSRSLDLIKYCVIHHSTGPNSLSALDIARYQVGPDCPTKFPEVAYHIIIEQDGTVVICHKWVRLVWNCGTGSPSSTMDDQGWMVGQNNWESAALCFAGTDPTKAQLKSIKWVADQADRDLGRKLVRLPHRLISKGGTVCPGDYAGWWPEVS